VSAPADALGVLRLGLALAYPAALATAAPAERGAWTPLVLFGMAAASDFADGVIARRAGAASAHGAVLDVVADVAFVVGATAAAASLGLVWPLVPAAIAVSVAAYAIASVGRARRRRRVDLARSRLGHAAGVLNYALVGLVSGAVALPGPVWPVLLATGSALVVAANLGAVAARLIRG
jgi:phosphatidylglycerophosphate synthase